MDSGKVVGIVLSALTAVFTSTTDAAELDEAAPYALSGIGNVVMGSQLENPHSKAIGQRVVGSVLMCLGGSSVFLGALVDASDVYSSSSTYEDMEDLGEVIEKLIWIEGSIMVGIGIPLFIVGRVKYGRWKKWETDHGRSLSFNGKGLRLEF